MRPVSLATHLAAVAVGVAIGIGFSHLKPAPTTASPPRSSVTIKATTKKETLPTIQPPTAANPLPQRLTEQQLARRYAVLEQLASEGRSFEIEISPNSFTLSPATAAFLDLSPDTRVAVQNAFDDAILAIRKLESQNHQQVPNTEGNFTVVVAAITDQAKSVESALRNTLSTVIPPEDVAILGKQIDTLFHDFGYVREVTHFPRQQSFYTSIILGNGRSYSGTLYGYNPGADPSVWRDQNSPLWRYSHLFPTTP